jgi:hypothetical protein
MALLGSRLKWNLISVRLEIVLILMDDSCMVWAKRTMALETILDAADGTPRCCGSSGISFPSVWRQCYCRCKISEWFLPDEP